MVAQYTVLEVIKSENELIVKTVEKVYLNKFQLFLLKMVVEGNLFKKIYFKLFFLIIVVKLTILIINLLMLKNL